MSMKKQWKTTTLAGVNLVAEWLAKPNETVGKLSFCERVRLTNGRVIVKWISNYETPLTQKEAAGLVENLMLLVATTYSQGYTGAIKEVEYKFAGLGFPGAGDKAKGANGKMASRA